MMTNLSKLIKYAIPWRENEANLTRSSFPWLASDDCSLSVYPFSTHDMTDAELGQWAKLRTEAEWKERRRTKLLMTLGGLGDIDKQVDEDWLERIEIAERAVAELQSRARIAKLTAELDSLPTTRATPEKETMDTQLPVDVLLVTVTDIEAHTVFSLVKQKYGREPQPRYIGLKTYYDLGTIGGAETWMVRSEMGSEGPSGSTVTVTEAIETLSPSAVIKVGIAFGVDPEKQSIGDILVSDKLRDYGLQRVGTDAEGKVDIIPRGDRVPASPRLLDRFQDGKLMWNGPKVELGLILSGPALVDNLDYRNQLRQFEREAVGGEMEGVGVYSAAHRHKVDWILVKGICDWADGKKRENKEERQQLAAQNAVGFVLHVIERGGLAKGGTPSSTDNLVVDGKIRVSGEDAENITGIDTGGRPTVLKPGTVVDVSGKRAKNITGVKS